MSTINHDQVFCMAVGNYYSSRMGLKHANGTASCLRRVHSDLSVYAVNSPILCGVRREAAEEPICKI
jgi:hypothetical protein